MASQETIVLRLERVEQLVKPCASSPFLKRRLEEDAEKYLVEKAKLLRHGAKVSVYLPQCEAGEARKIPEAFHEHFAFRRDEARKELRRIRQFGWRSLFIGLLFLSFAIAVVQIARRYLPAGNPSSVLQEGLTILAWVALWRPGELLLYEWYPFKRDANLFDKLAHAEIQVIQEQ